MQGWLIGPRVATLLAEQLKEVGVQGWLIGPWVAVLLAEQLKEVGCRAG